MSVDLLPTSLARLIGQHPAALRSVCWAQTPDAAGARRYLEIETKHGSVTLIDCGSGRVYAQPPLPPDVDVRLPRWQQDLTESLPAAFAGRPRFSGIVAAEQGGWQFHFDTGAAFTLTPGDGIQIVSD